MKGICTCSFEVEEQPLLYVCSNCLFCHTHMLQNGVTPLMVACQSGDICSEAAMILMAHGARVDGLSDVRALHQEMLNM